MRVNKFVLDTNIWISYFITGKEQLLIDIIGINDITVFSCAELIEEIATVLAYKHLDKFNVDIKAAIEIVKNVTVPFSIVYPIKRYIPDDPDDDYLIALALQTNSGFVTSGDQHILAHKSELESKFQKLRILTKNEFESRFSNIL